MSSRLASIASDSRNYASSATACCPVSGDRSGQTPKGCPAPPPSQEGSDVRRQPSKDTTSRLRQQDRQPIVSVSTSHLRYANSGDSLLLERRPSGFIAIAISERGETQRCASEAAARSDTGSRAIELRSMCSP